MKSREKGTNKQGIDGNVEASRDSMRELAPETEQQDGRDSPEAQKANRKKMGVEEDHKTKKMEKENRGTYP